MPKKPCRPWYDPNKCPKYDGVFLRNITRQILKDTRLNQTLTNVVIPSFDEKKINPVVFSNFKVSRDCIMLFEPYSLSFIQILKGKERKE